MWRDGRAKAGSWLAAASTQMGQSRIRIGGRQCPIRQPGCIPCAGRCHRLHGSRRLLIHVNADRFGCGRHGTAKAGERRAWDGKQIAGRLREIPQQDGSRRINTSACASLRKAKSHDKCWIGRQDRAYRGGRAADLLRHPPWVSADRLELGWLDWGRAVADSGVCSLSGLFAIRNQHLRNAPTRLICSR